jgi:hypothetical protein
MECWAAAIDMLRPYAPAKGAVASPSVTVLDGSVNEEQARVQRGTAAKSGRPPSPPPPSLPRPPVQAALYLDVAEENIRAVRSQQMQPYASHPGRVAAFVHYNVRLTPSSRLQPPAGLFEQWQAENSGEAAAAAALSDRGGAGTGGKAGSTLAS